MTLLFNATKAIRINPLKTDPTRTGAIRRAFMADMRRRFNRLKREVDQLVRVEDVFGLDLPPPPSSPGRTLARLERFAFISDPQKAKEFRAWLKGQIDEGILVLGPGGGDLANPWTAEYIQRGYRKGTEHAYDAANRAGVISARDGQLFFEGGKNQFMSEAFNSPKGIERLQTLATRSFENLKGISADMSQQLNRVLVDGFASGKGARKIAREMSQQIEGITRKRALVIARTEVVHAYNEAQLDAFERLGVDDIGVMAEWSTAANACPLCFELEGTVMTVKEARGILPRHPNCKCAWIPANVGESKGGQKRTKTEKEKALKESVKREVSAKRRDGTKRTLKQRFADSRWPGSDLRGKLLGPRSRLKQKGTRALPTTAEERGSLRGLQKRRTGLNKKVKAGTATEAETAELAEVREQLEAMRADFRRQLKGMEDEVGEINKRLAGLDATSTEAKVIEERSSLIARKMGLEDRIKKTGGTGVKSTKKTATKKVVKKKSAKQKNADAMRKDLDKVTIEDVNDLNSLADINQMRDMQRHRLIGQGELSADDLKLLDAIDARQDELRSLRDNKKHQLRSFKKADLKKEMGVEGARERDIIRERFKKSGKKRPIQAHGMDTAEDMIGIEIDGVEFWVPESEVSSVGGSKLNSVVKLIDETDNMPKALWEANDRIVYSTQRNNRDAYWAEQYNTPDFRSAATGGDGTVVTYNDAMSLDTFSHESGHNFANKAWSQTRPPKGFKGTKDRKLADKYRQTLDEKTVVVGGKQQIRVENSVSNYGANDVAEDWAEACMQYADNRKRGATSVSPARSPRDSLRKRFPKRYDAVQALIDPDEFVREQAARKVAAKAAKKEAAEAAEARAKEALKIARDLIKKAKEAT